MLAAVADVIRRIESAIVNPLIVFLFGAALILFLWGAFTFIRDAHSDEGRELGKKHLIWGLVGMIIMVSVYAILNIVVGTFGVDLPS